MVTVAGGQRHQSDLTSLRSCAPLVQSSVTFALVFVFFVLQSVAFLFKIAHFFERTDIASDLIKLCSVQMHFVTIQEIHTDHRVEEQKSKRRSNRFFCLVTIGHLF